MLAPLAASIQFPGNPELTGLELLTSFWYILGIKAFLFSSPIERRPKNIVACFPILKIESS
jgi:hypothetical protein